MSANEEEMKIVFESYDTDRSGKISVKEFGCFAAEIGLEMTPAQVESFLTEFDKDGNKQLDFTEFKKLVAVAQQRYGSY